MELQSLEQSVKDQFAKVFASRDWQLFKEVAEINLAEATALKTSAFKAIVEKRRLLIRNSRKRLLIGIGAELLLKAVYLKSGYGINKPRKDAGPRLPFKLAEVAQDQLDPSVTFPFDQLIQSVKKVVHLPQPGVVLDGLRIAKVFRNKEGHAVTQSHTFDPSSYRAIEAALVELHARAFNETLTIRFSFAVGEKGIWRVDA